ncbi:MAG: hypothetical protein EKK71_15220 [Candidatus Competibacteraceae bacterium]|nr:MAG: hypothetical protein EKK71_15220 [Candidatus Competibacteraceae bacterium]
MTRQMDWIVIGSMWAVLAGPVHSATLEELDRLGAAYCQSIGTIVVVAAQARDAGISEDAQRATALQHPTDPDIDRLTLLSISRVYRDARPGTVIAAEIVDQCQHVLPHRNTP